jgi:hypothetical protein
VAEGTQIGPWGAAGGIDSCLLDHALGETRTVGSVFADVPEANSDAATLLEERGFMRAGRAVLMFRGVRPAYRPEHVYAFATMGSMG